MADRKQFATTTAPDPELAALLEAARGQEVTEEELHEQRVSFAYGNALNSDRITKESVRRTSQNIRLRG